MGWIRGSSWWMTGILAGGVDAMEMISSSFSMFNSHCKDFIHQQQLHAGNHVRKIRIPIFGISEWAKNTGAGWSGTFYRSTFPRISTLLKDINNGIMFSKINPFKVILNQSLSRHTLCWHCHSLDLNSTYRCAYNKLKHQPANHQLTKKEKNVLPHPKKTFMSSLSPFLVSPLIPHSNL